MPSRAIRLRAVDTSGYSYYTLWQDYVWNRSPRVNGVLRLDRPLAHNRVKRAVRSWDPGLSPDGTTSSSSSIFGANTQFTAQAAGYEKAQEVADNNAQARWVKRAKGTDASLGVTAATYRQTASMIANRTRRIGQQLDLVASGIERQVDRLARRRGIGYRDALYLYKKRRYGREPLANQVLEGYFGWKPLLQDIHDGLEIISTPPPQFYWLTGRAQQPFEHHTSSETSTYRRTISHKGVVYSAYSARFEVESQNLWLANRLGLINPATVIWDLVPWSFLVNMFVNVNQMINSVTDEVGLNVDRRSLTRRQTYQSEVNHVRKQSGPKVPTAARSVLAHANKQRSLVSGISYNWVVRLPNANWDVAAIGSSLLLQKARRLNSLVALF